MVDAHTPAVSVIVPMYNAESYVETAVRRLLDQSCSDFEVLLIDDASEDSTLRIAHELGAVDRRITLYALPENMGVAAARNYGLRHARGKYVWLVDIDDEWDDRFLEIMLTTARRSEADVVVCSAVYRYGAAHLEEDIARYQHFQILHGDDALECLLLGTGALWNKLFRRGALLRDPFPPPAFEIRLRRDLAPPSVPPAVGARS